MRAARRVLEKILAQVLHPACKPRARGRDLGPKPSKMRRACNNATPPAHRRARRAYHATTARDAGSIHGTTHAKGGCV